MNRNVANTGDGGKNKRKIGGLQESQERGEALRANNLKLVFLIGCKIAQSQGSLALDLGSRRVHEMDQRLY